MKIVIDIPNWLYNAIMEHREPVYSQSLGDAVRDGTPLPKGHGRLIDADEVKRKMGNLDGFGMIGRCIDEFSTIVDADKEKSEDSE